MNRSTVNPVRKHTVLMCRKNCQQLFKEVSCYGSDYLKYSGPLDCQPVLVKLFSNLA